MKRFLYCRVTSNILGKKRSITGKSAYLRTSFLNEISPYDLHKSEKTGVLEWNLYVRNANGAGNSMSAIAS
jgi:hypothetical protein